MEYKQDRLPHAHFLSPSSRDRVAPSLQGHTVWEGGCEERPVGNRELIRESLGETQLSFKQEPRSGHVSPLRGHGILNKT